MDVLQRPMTASEEAYRQGYTIGWRDADHLAHCEIPSEWAYDGVIDWLLRHQTDNLPSTMEAFETVLLRQALRNRNGRIFWSALVIAGYFVASGTGWRPHHYGLACMVQDIGAMVERKVRTVVTVAEAAEVLGCSAVHVRRLIAAGKIQATWFATKPGQWLINNESVYAHKLASRA